MNKFLLFYFPIYFKITKPFLNEPNHKEFFVIDFKFCFLLQVLINKKQMILIEDYLKPKVIRDVFLKLLLFRIFLPSKINRGFLALLNDFLFSLEYI